MAKKLTKNVYIHPDPDTGTEGGWFGPDYPENGEPSKEQLAQVTYDGAFADDDEVGEVPGPGQTTIDLNRVGTPAKKGQAAAAEPGASDGNQ